MSFTPVPGMRVRTANYGLGTVVRATRAGAVVTLDRMGKLGIELPLSQLSPLDPVVHAAPPVPPAPVSAPSIPAVNGHHDPAPPPVDEPARPVPPPVVEQLESEGNTAAGASSAADAEADIEADAEADEREVSGEPESAQLPAFNDAIVEVDLGARRSVEALRFGVVPTESISEVTVGYQALERWVARQLPGGERERPSVSEVFGPFGTGKSHTMAAIRHIASARGFATAYVEVDGKGITLSDPASVLASLWRTIAAQDLESATPLLDLNLRALEKGRSLAIGALDKFERVQANLLTIDTLKRTSCIDQHGEQMELILACDDLATAIEARRTMAPDVSPRVPWGRGAEYPLTPMRLIGKEVFDRPDDFVECLIGYSALAKLAGYKGLVVTIDEFEVESAQLTRKQLERLEDVITTLGIWFGGRGKQKTGPLALFIATVGEEGHLGDEVVEMLVRKTSGDQYPLKKWTRAAHKKLAERIFNLYRRAYSIDGEFDESLASTVQDRLDEADLEGSGMVRAFIKGYVAELDATFGPMNS